MYRKLVDTVLVHEGYKVFFAQDGREALSVISEHKPQLVVTDWEMPDISGLELCKKLRNEQATYTYVILLTSNTEKEQIVQGLAAGADDYLTKPFHAGELLARVAVGRRVTNLHRQIQEKNALLEALAQTDSLTGLPNRRTVEEWAQRELAGASRYDYPFWVVLADLDHFKSINDTYGHEAGDIVLKKFAQLLRGNTRASSLCGRFGGEEFVIAIGHVNKKGVQTAIERLRKEFESTSFEFNGSALKATASFGISAFSRGDAGKLDQLLRKADEALYSAKHKGRNRLEFAS